MICRRHGGQINPRDVVAEFPFAPAGLPNRIEGRDALYDDVKGFSDVMDVQSMPKMRISDSLDPKVAVAERSAAGARLKSAIALDGPHRFAHGAFDLTVLSDAQLVMPLSIVSAQAAAGETSGEPENILRNDRAISKINGGDGGIRTLDTP